MPHPVKRSLRTGLLAFGLLAAGLGPSAAFDPAPAPVEAGQAGFDAARLKAIGDFVRRDIAAGKIPGMVLLVMRDGKPVMFDAFGERAPGSPMQRDSLHRIASTTKMFVTTAALRLYEQGRFKLTDPVATYLPELKDLKVFAGAESGTGTDGPPRRRPSGLRPWGI